MLIAIVVLLVIVVALLSATTYMLYIQHTTRVERPAPMATNLAHVLKRHDGKWVQTGRMVRLDSKSADAIIAAPGVALRLHNGKIKEGVQ